MTAGLPDWGSPVDRDGVRLFAAHLLDDVRIALPDALTIATAGDGRPRFHLTAIRPAVPMAGRQGHGRLDMELRLDSLAANADGTIRAAPPLRGWLRLRSAMLDLPPELATPGELDCSGLGFARLTLPLAASGVATIESVLAEGATPILAHVDVEVAGIAPRLPCQAIVDLARFRAALADGTMTPARLAEALANDPAAVGVTLADGGPDLPAAAIADALADHIRARLCPGPLSPAPEEGLALTLADAQIATGTARLDLAVTLVATRVVTVALDPFASARSLAQASGGIAGLITRGQSGLLPTGRHEMTVDDSVPRPCIGPLALGATLTFPPRPPARNHPVVEAFELPASGDGVTRQVRLAPGEPVAWALSGFAFWPTPDGRNFERLEGAAMAGSGTQALLRPDAFPLGFVDVAAGAVLLDLAEVELTLGGVRPGGAAARATVTLTAAAPHATLALPADAGDTMLACELVALGSGRRIALPPRPATDWRVELSEVPGYGPRAVELVATLPGGTPLVAIEVLAEDAPDDAAPETYAFTRQVPVRTHRWLCRDPFRPGLRWRWRGQADFSAPFVAPRMELDATVLPA